jgi:signal transduction histidine kinase
VEDSTRVLRDTDGVARFYEGVVTDVDADKRRQQNLAESLEAQVALNRKLESAQNQLLQSEKMASIGQLAAGVAHEINNPIGFVNSNLNTLGNYVNDLLQLAEAGAASTQGQALAEKLDLAFLRSDIPALMAESKDGLDRVRKIVQDLKDFSRVGEMHWQLADINRGIDSTLNIVANEIKYKCTLRKEFAVLPQIYCLPSQLNQVFMNLLVNAAQAVETKGEILIRTECVGSDAVRVTIADTGRGIPPQHLNRLFEPFFTTKPVGKGTGLGLSLAWGIIARHHGRIEVESEVGKGSTFTITLPVKPPVDAETATASAVSPAPTF